MLGGSLLLWRTSTGCGSEKQIRTVLVLVPHINGTGIWIVCRGKTHFLHYQHMVNDVVADSAGNAYLTNSYGDFIWKVTMEGIASVFAKNSIFLSQLVVVNSSVA
jgi:hypothetical protein